MTLLAWLAWLLALADAGATADVASCQHTADRFGASIKTVVAAGRPQPVPLTLATRLVGFRAAARYVEAPLVEVTRERIALDGRVVDGAGAQRLAELRKRVAELYHLYGQLFPNRAAPDHVVLAVDRDVAWSELVGVTGALAAAGVRNLDWMFATQRAGGVIATPPAPSAIDSELAEIRALTVGADKAARLGDLLARVVATCPTVRKLIADFAEADLAMRGALLAEGLGPAVASCGCALDMTAFEAVLFVTLGPGGEAPHGVVRLRLAVAGGRPLKAAATAPWSKGFRQVVDAARGRGATDTYRLIAR